jgi:hypothetical protein
VTLVRGATARTLLALAVVTVGFVAYAVLARETPETGAAGGGEVVDVEVNYALEPTDEEQLVGFATNVFVGRVVEKVGAEGAPLSGPGGEVVPRTQFSVAVLENIKGDLGDEVTVSQTGGYDGSEDRRVRVEGDPLLRPGQQGLFVTSHDEREGWYTIVAQPFGDVRIESESQRTDLVEKFERARRAQVPFEPAADR